MPNDTTQIKSLVIAPFFSQVATTSRPLLVSEVLVRFGNVDIVTTSFNHQTKDANKFFQFNDGRTIHFLPTIPYRHNVSPVRFLSHLMFSLRAWFYYLRRKREYDLVYVTLPLNLIAMLVFLTSSGKLKIADVIDIWPDVLPFPVIVKKILCPFFLIWKKSFSLAVSLCDVLLTVSDRFMEDSISCFRRDKSSAQRFYIGAKRLPRNTNKNNDLLTIVYIGNIGHLYDFETLLLSMMAYHDKVRFFLVGDGDRKDWLLSELKNMKLEHRYFGVVYDDTLLAEILSQCDVGFNGYINTTAAFSYKANTYFAAALPIINSMSGDLNDLVLKNDLGFNYISGNVESLTISIKRCISTDLAKVSSNVCHFFDSELERDVIKIKMAKFISELLREKGIKNETCH